MKHKMPKKPTRAQKEIMENAGYSSGEWLIQHEDRLSLTLVHRDNGKRKVILL